MIDGEKVNDLVVTPGVLIAAVVVIGAFFVLHRTRIGRTVYAIGGSENSSASSWACPSPARRSSCT